MGETVKIAAKNKEELVYEFKKVLRNDLPLGATEEWLCGVMHPIIYVTFTQF